MDLSLILVIAAAFGLGLMLALLVLGRRGAAGQGEAARSDIQEVSGRLAQMAEELRAFFEEAPIGGDLPSDHEEGGDEGAGEPPSEE